MTKNPCPLCERPNALSAKFCSACGTALSVRCARCAARNKASRSTCSECGGSLQAAAPSDLNLVLLDVDDPIPHTDTGSDDDAPDKPELVRSDPDPQPAPVAGADAKTARRAAVRRAVTASAAAQAATDLMVFDEDDEARAALCELLTGFGFDAVPVRSHAEAARLLRLGSFAAVFLQVSLDGSGTDDAAQLCRLVKLQANAGAPAAALVVIADVARPVDRVRATMAGADDFLVKPLNRGAIAHTLEVCGVALPSDSRRI
jgi:CheY-like chemotaxis protein